MEIINRAFIEFDKFCDYIPFISILSNSVDIIAKSILMTFSSTSTSTNHHFKYLREKNFYRCIILLIPIFGNIYIALYDSYKASILNEDPISIFYKLIKRFPLLAKNDKDVVLEAVKHNGRALAWASRSLQADADFVLEALKCDPVNILKVNIIAKSVSKSLKSNGAFIEQVQSNPYFSFCMMHRFNS